MIQLLVSVADGVEARAALAGGADVIDAKDPRRGALGVVPAAALSAIRAAVSATRPVSAALGDALDERHVGRRACAAAAQGVTFVKVGFAGLSAPARAWRLAAAAREGAGEHTGLMLVAYADWAAAGSLAPDTLVAVAADAGAIGVVLDTALKGAPLFQLVRPRAVGTWVARAHASGLLVGLAGSLGAGDFATASALGADLVGVRGAACVGGRCGRVSPRRVAALRAAVRAAPGPGVLALV